MEETELDKSNEGSAAVKILNFLREAGEEKTPREDFIDALTHLTRYALESSENPALINQLKNFGWDGHRFSSEVDVQGLKMALTNRSRAKSISIAHRGNTRSDNTKSFVPAMLMNKVLQIVDRGEMALTPLSFFFNGTIMLADISGFTKLSGQYCSRGKDGIDDLQCATNVYMGKLVEIIYAHGGDIVKFAGDAIICVFSPKSEQQKDEEIGLQIEVPAGRVDGSKVLEECSNSEGKQAEFCMRAVHCAMELRNIATVQLTVHVALSVGEICFGVLGGHDDKWECLISGDCIFQISQCLDDAPSKQAVVTPQCMKVLGPSFRSKLRTEELPPGNHKILELEHCPELFHGTVNTAAITNTVEYEDPIFLSLLSNFVPFPVAIGVMSNSFDFISELREVTTMFMKWDSYDSQEHRDLLSLQKMFFAAQDILCQTGAFMRQFLVDDKGCVLIACWGVPSATYIDNCNRALSAAVLIRDALSQFNMKCSFGLTTGNVFCGSIGCFLRREYAAIGNVVNLAARLMSKAKGNIFVDEATYSRLPSTTQSLLTEQEPIAVKGRTEPLMYYSYTAKSLLYFANKGKVDDLDVRATCKSIMLTHLERMENDENCSIKSVHTSYSGDDLQRFLPVGLRTPRKPNSIVPTSGKAPKASIKFILLEGKVGAGKAEAISWLKQQANNRHIRVLDFQMSAKDSQIEYRVLAKLFRELIHDDVFDNANRQRTTIALILKEIYGDDTETAEYVAFPAMRIALGVTCNLRFGKTSVSFERSHSRKKALETVRCSRSPKNMSSSAKIRRLPPHVVMETLREIFEHLLNSQLVVAVIRKIHFADEASLKTLLNFKDIHSKSVILMTSVNPEELDSEIKKHRQLMIATGGSSISPNTGSSSHRRRDLSGLFYTDIENEECDENTISHSSINWMSSLRNRILTLDNTTVISLKDFTIAEIDTILCSTLQVNKLPTAFASTVYQLSAGSPFWVREVIEFIKSTGYEAFLHSINGEQNEQSAHGDQNKISQSKLEQFIVCRFERLNPDEQRILRKASIIGYRFSRYELYGVLGSKLRSHMYSALRMLIKQNWITQSPTNDAEYYFNHPVLHMTLYGLTPSSERKTIHQEIAEYVEDMNPDSPFYYTVLYQHYSESLNTEKAFEYSIKSALHLITLENFDIEKALLLIYRSLTYCETLIDIQFVQKILRKAKFQFLLLLKDKQHNDDESTNLERIDEGNHSEKEINSSRSISRGNENNIRFSNVFCCFGTAHSTAMVVVPLDHGLSDGNNNNNNLDDNSAPYEGKMSNSNSVHDTDTSCNSNVSASNRNSFIVGDNFNVKEISFNLTDHALKYIHNEISKLGEIFQNAYTEMEEQQEQRNKLREGGEIIPMQQEQQPEWQISVLGYSLLSSPSNDLPASKSVKSGGSILRLSRLVRGFSNSLERPLNNTNESELNQTQKTLNVNGTIMRKSPFKKNKSWSTGNQTLNNDTSNQRPGQFGKSKAHSIQLATFTDSKAVNHTG